ncbi:MAG: hypothetical protein ACYSR1_03750 [Planctomycetota bacterium]|jgi:hypothetical protein
MTSILNAKGDILLRFKYILTPAEEQSVKTVKSKEGIIKACIHLFEKAYI